MSDTSFDELILGLIEASSVAGYRTWLGTARLFFGAASAVMAPLSSSPNEWWPGISSRLSADREDRYRSRFHLVDTWFHRIRAAQPGQAFTTEMLVPEAELLHSEFYTEYLLASGYRHRLGMMIEADKLRFLLVFLRQKTQQNFNPNQVETLQKLGPFLQAALSNRRRQILLEAQQAAFRELINQYPYGALLIDASLRVVFFNKLAGEYIGSEDGLLIRNGQLVASDSNDEWRFANALKSASAAAGEHSILTLKGVKSGERVAISIVGLPRAETPLFQVATDQPAAVVLVAKSARSRDIEAGDLESLLGFTPQEAQTASLLLAGHGVAEIARELSITRATVRYFLRSLFGKTGTHSQRELVSFIGSSIPPSVIGRGDGGSRSNGGN